jgi:hypothetical protein
MISDQSVGPQFSLPPHSSVLRLFYVRILLREKDSRAVKN